MVPVLFWFNEMVMGPFLCKMNLSIQNMSIIFSKIVYGNWLSLLNVGNYFRKMQEKQ